MTPLLLLLPLAIQAGDPSQGDLGAHPHTPQQEIMREVAQKKFNQEVGSSQDSGNSSRPNKPIFFSFKDSSGELLASLGLDTPLTVDLANTMCETGIVVDKKCCNGKGESKCDGPGRIIVNATTIINFLLVGGEASAESAKGENDSLETLTLNITYKGLPPLNVTGLTVTEAQLTLKVTTKGLTRPDYWNMTSASLSLTGTMGDKALPAQSDVTPKVGYSWAEPACTAPYGICAPRGLSWTCTDQVLAPETSVVSKLKLGDQTVRVHLPGLLLKLGNSTEEVFNWDCEPLIPLSIWVSVLITLFLASLLMWGICMLANLQTPSKFDDPKGPSIHVPTTE